MPVSKQNNSKNANDRSRWIQFLLVSYLVIFGYLWLVEKPAKKPGAEGSGAAATETSATLAAASRLSSETLALEKEVVAGSSSTLAVHPGPLVSGKTDKYRFDVDSVGGVIHSWRLIDPGSESYKPDPNSTGIELVRRIPSVIPGVPARQMWPLEIGFKEHNVHSYEDFNRVAWKNVPLDSPVGGDSVVRLKSPSINGLRVEKQIIIPKDKYYSTLKITIYNETSATVPIVDEFNRGLTVRWGPGLLDRKPGEFGSRENSYDVAIARGAEDVKTFRPKVDGDPLEMNGALEWAGVESKFFTALLVPYQPDDKASRIQYHFRTMVPSSNKIDLDTVADPVLKEKLADYHPPLVVELGTDQFTLPAHSSKTFEFGLYIGPKKHSILKQYGHNLKSLMFSDSWSWMRVIYLGLTDLLNWLHRHVASNYGIDLILLTIMVKLLVFPLVMRSVKIQAKSSAEMKRVKPHIDAINEKYKDNAQEKQRQTWKVYQEHGINPLGAMRSCLPVLPQAPIFVGLYRIAENTIDLQHAHFLWIKDLSQADAFYHFLHPIPFIGPAFNLLPILVAFTQMASSKISMARTLQNVTDDNQRQMQKMMVYMVPLFVMVTMYSFPAGLMVYWMASNGWQIGQSLLTNRVIDREEKRILAEAPAPRKQRKEGKPGFFQRVMEQANAAKEEAERRQKQQQKPGKKR